MNRMKTKKTICSVVALYAVVSNWFGNFRNSPVSIRRQHLCKQPCHHGECGPCEGISVITCRCGAKTKVRGYAYGVNICEGALIAFLSVLENIADKVSHNWNLFNSITRGVVTTDNNKKRNNKNFCGSKQKLWEMFEQEAEDALSVECCIFACHRSKSLVQVSLRRVKTINHLMINSWIDRNYPHHQ